MIHPRMTYRGFTVISLAKSKTVEFHTVKVTDPSQSHPLYSEFHSFKTAVPTVHYLIYANVRIIPQLYHQHLPSKSFIEFSYPSSCYLTQHRVNAWLSAIHASRTHPAGKYSEENVNFF
jgi:hypothetical protein